MREFPIKDYALIGNCETAALVNPDGGIDWLCLPAFDGPSFFGALLDRQHGGQFSIHPAEPSRVERRYLEDTAILETRFVTDRGTIRLTDFFVVARQPRSRFYDFALLERTCKLVRLLELEDGTDAVVEIQAAPRPEYAKRRAAWRKVDGGFDCPEAALFSNLPLVEAGGDIGGTFTLEAGKPCFLVLDSAEIRRCPDAAAVARWLEITTAFWREWGLFNYYRGPHQGIIRRSAVTLKLLTYAPSGAIVAAPTTSLPERAGGDLNWDYRFTWVRDTALFINALFRLGYSGEAKAYFDFITGTDGARRSEDDRAGADLPVLLPVREGTPVAEETLDHLAGYLGSRPVRRGNGAEDQLQIDNYGHFLQSLFFWTHTGGAIAKARRDMAAGAVEAVSQRWAEPDNGIWEARERRQRTYSKVSAWLALRRAADLGLIGLEEAESRCAGIHADVMAHGVSARGGRQYLAEQYGGSEIDATALLGFTTGFLPAPLAISTREEIEARLGVGPWLYRSDTHRASGEGAFVLCSFWRVGQLIREGNLERAESLLNDIIAAASPLGLFSEEIDPVSGAFLGNFPQAFSHLGLIASVLDLEQAKAEPGFAQRPDHEKFQRGVGRTIGVRGVIAGFWRAPQTFRLLLFSRSRWR